MNNKRIFRNITRPASLFVLAAWLTACATQPAAPPEPMTHCRSGNVLLDAHFDGGQLGQCSSDEPGQFSLVIYPEDTPPINDSPWYAFRVSGSPGDSVSVNMRVEHGMARYWPKLSTDGLTWKRAPHSQVQFSEDGSSMQLELQLSEATL